MISRTSLKEVARVSGGIFLLGIIEFVIFLFAGADIVDTTIGILLGCACSSFNFLILAITLEFSLSGNKIAGLTVGASYILRLTIAAIVIYISIKSQYINHWAAIIPLFFQSIVIIILSILPKGELQK